VNNIIVVLGVLSVMAVGCALEPNEAVVTATGAQSDSPVDLVVLTGMTRCPWRFSPECHRAQGGAMERLHTAIISVPLKPSDVDASGLLGRRGWRYRIELNHVQLTTMAPSLSIHQGVTDRAGELTIGIQPQAEGAWELYGSLMVVDLSLNGKPTGPFEMTGSEPLADRFELSLDDLAAQLGCSCLYERNLLYRCATDAAECT
jgi:hypothetical protein